MDGTYNCFNKFHIPGDDIFQIGSTREKERSDLSRKTCSNFDNKKNNKGLPLVGVLILHVQRFTIFDTVGSLVWED